jgi:hypothetical protein
VDDLAFATMFENDNVCIGQTANELHLILTKLKLNDELSAKQIEVNTLVQPLEFPYIITRLLKKLLCIVFFPAIDSIFVT